MDAVPRGFLGLPPSADLGRPLRLAAAGAGSAAVAAVGSPHGSVLAAGGEVDQQAHRCG